MKISGNSLCPCGSLKKFKKCCRIFHFGENPKNALELMKSRYSAFVANDANYIIKTTHRENKDYTSNKESWIESINSFTYHSSFKGLEILDFKDGDEIAYVTFKAKIFQGAIDSTFVEKSKFIKVEDEWKYYEGEFIN